MATLRKKNEKWVLDYTLFGRRRRLWFQDRMTGEQALRAVENQELKAKLTGVDAALFEVSIAHAIEAFLSAREDRVTFNNELTYMTRFYEFMCEKHFRLKSVKEIELRHLIEFRDYRLTEVEAATVVREFGIYRVFIRECIARKWIHTDPFIGFKGKRGRTPVRRLWTDEEIRLVHRNMPSFLQDVFAFLALTGVRPIEALTLTRRDVAEKAVSVHCWKNKQDGTRMIGLSDEAWEIVRRRLAFHSSEYVFSNSLGQKINNDYLLKQFARVRKDLGLGSDLNLYALRHTFASRLVEKNVNLKIVQDLLGHSQIRTTEKYLKVRTDVLSEAANLNKLGLIR